MSSPSPECPTTPDDPATPSENRCGRLPAVPAAGADLSLADVTERLMAEFGAHLDVSAISRIVLHCRHDLAGAPSGAMPELVERLARERLLQTFPAARPEAVTS